MTDLFNGWTARDWVAAYAAVVATSTFAWNVWRELRDRSQLRVHVGVKYAVIYDASDPPQVQGGFTCVTVTNVGRRTSHVTELVFEQFKSPNGLYLHPFPQPPCLLPPLPHELKEGAVLEFVVPIDVLKQEGVKGVHVLDSHHSKWRPSRKMFKRAVKLAHEPPKLRK